MGRKVREGGVEDGLGGELLWREGEEGRGV